MYGKAAKLEIQMDAKLAWLLEKYYYHSQESVGCSSSQADLYLTEKELHQLHIDEEALRETLEEQAMKEKVREEKIRQKQADDDEFFMEFGVVRYDSEYDARVEPSPYTPNSVFIIPGPTGIVQLSSSTCVEPSFSTPNLVRIIPGPAGVVQRAKLLRENVFILDTDGALMSTQEYMQKVAENVVKSCSSNVLGDLNVTIKDLSKTIPETVHHKVIGDSGYENDITVRAAMILANVSVFTPKPLEHYLNNTKRNVVKDFPPEKPPMPSIFSYPTVEESVQEHDTCDEYLTEGFLTKKEQQQLAQDEDVYREYLKKKQQLKKNEQKLRKIERK
nr:hypothetical protein [Tanacetum cinerariifolium]